MANSKSEIQRRTDVGLAAIRSAYGTPEAEWNVTLFIDEHIEALEPDYWQEKTGTATPEPKAVLDLIELKSHWSADDDEGENGIEVFDFTLPDDVTNYLLSVRFDNDGKISELDLES